KACLELDITHIESLCNLEALIGQGEFRFIGLPLKWRGGTGSPIPAGAVVEEESQTPPLIGLCASLPLPRPALASSRRPRGLEVHAMVSFTITPLTAHSGVEVGGLDFTQPIDTDTGAHLRRAFAEHHVLVMRDQHFAPDQFETAAQVFGEIQLHDK